MKNEKKEKLLKRVLVRNPLTRKRKVKIGSAILP
jgi:hypothetical protein